MGVILRRGVVKNWTEDKPDAGKRATPVGHCCLDRSFYGKIAVYSASGHHFDEL
jgi:hypothetical protein